MRLGGGASRSGRRVAHIVAALMAHHHVVMVVAHHHVVVVVPVVAMRQSRRCHAQNRSHAHDANENFLAEHDHCPLATVDGLSIRLRLYNPSRLNGC